MFVRQKGSQNRSDRAVTAISAWLPSAGGQNAILKLFLDIKRHKKSDFSDNNNVTDVNNNDNDTDNNSNNKNKNSDDVDENNDDGDDDVGDQQETQKQLDRFRLPYNFQQGVVSTFFVKLVRTGQGAAAAGMTHLGPRFNLSNGRTEAKKARDWKSLARL